MATYADALERARQMRAFYQPAYFGPEMTTYSDPLGWTPEREGPSGAAPATIGGFGFRGLEQPLPGTEGLPAAPPEMQQRARTQYAYDPSHAQVGSAQLQNYGMGQLQNYGTGALKHYGVGALQRRR